MEGIFSNQKNNLRNFFEGFAIEDVGKFNGHLVYLMAV
jgi:hypothetical protein